MHRAPRPASCTRNWQSLLRTESRCACLCERLALQRERLDDAVQVVCAGVPACSLVLTAAGRERLLHCALQAGARKKHVKLQLERSNNSDLGN